MIDRNVLTYDWLIVSVIFDIWLTDSTTLLWRQDNTATITIPPIWTKRKPLKSLNTKKNMIYGDVNPRSVLVQGQTCAENKPVKGITAVKKFVWKKSTCLSLKCKLCNINSIREDDWYIIIKMWKIYNDKIEVVFFAIIYNFAFWQQWH